MKVVGIVAEYNPFHNGHKYHIEEAKKQTGADYVIVVMSGNFVQRGEPAIINKYSRAKSALKAGADLVFELPVIYSTSSAQFFALGAVALLDNLKCVDYLCFGSESGSLGDLSLIANYLLLNEEEYNDDINKFMKTGVTFPLARQKALKKNNPNIDDKLISSPNNILAIEYLKALIMLKSNIKPFTITRKDAGYHEYNLNIQSNNKTYNISSATSLRHSLTKKPPINIIKSHVPSETFEILSKEYQKTFPIYQNDFSLILKYKLLQENSESLCQYVDVSPDLANRIINTPFVGHNFLSLTKKLKTRQWTLTRINRALIHILLNLKKQDLVSYNNNGYCLYTRLLGFKKTSSHLVNTINDNAKVPLITKMSNADKVLDKLSLQMLKEDVFASDVYNLIVEEKFSSPLPNEFRQGLVIEE